ncbi:MAG TPA: hypothetical protein VGX68_15915 [Thermoanaerobaculia bacterium]|jgi:hypothetical protein|nr:hypothetical protein [Thermoanaerobaculia bacterium]
MTRLTLTLAFLGWLATPAAHAFFDSYLVIAPDGVSLVFRENGDVYSAAAVTCKTYFGDDDLGCKIQIDHLIKETLLNVEIGGNHRQVLFEYNSYVRRPPFLDGNPHCYRAQLSGSVVGGTYSNFWGSPQRCLGGFPTEPPPKPDPPEENCPILLDLKQDGFHLSGPDPAVSFDINADGNPDQIAWTKAGEDDAFLCLDRNGNGVIDDGRELFGYSTPLLSGEPAQVGYRALADLDRSELGGNNDGRVDASDNGFSGLCAWVDTNRDGISQPGEIHALAEVGVVALDYDYRTTGIRDSFGNLFRYASSAMMRARSGAVRPWRTYDVIFSEP